METSESLSKKIKRFPILVYSVILLLGMLLMILPHLESLRLPTAWQSIMRDIGIDVFATALVFFILHFFILDDFTSNQNRFEALENKIVAIVRKAVNLHNPFAPDHEYSSMEREHGKEYNKDLTADLCKSTSYIYRGTNPVFVPVRLKGANIRRLNETIVITLDPKNEKLLESEAVDQLNKARYDNNGESSLEQGSINARKEILRKELYMALAGLFTCRHEHPSKVVFINSITGVNTIEGFDEHVYISIDDKKCHDPESHPPSIRYDERSPLYLMYMNDCRRLLEREDRHKFLVFDRETKEQDFLNALTSIGDPFTTEQLQCFIREFNEFYESKKYINRVSAKEHDNASFANLEISE